MVMSQLIWLEILCNGLGKSSALVCRRQQIETRHSQGESAALVLGILGTVLATWASHDYSQSSASCGPVSAGNGIQSAHIAAAARVGTSGAQPSR